MTSTNLNGGVVVVCMHQSHTRYDDWEITCNDCGADLSDNLEVVSFYVPDNFMRKWYDYPTPTKPNKGDSDE